MEFHYLFLFAFGCFVESSVLCHNFGIIGGHPINITEAPFMALFTYEDDKIDFGAAIVHQQFVVTVAQVATKKNYSTYVTVGTDNVNSGEKYEVEHVFVHPKFTRDTFDYDIAVVKLKKKLEWSDKVKSIEIADTHIFDTIKNGDMLTTMGFGYTGLGDMGGPIIYQGKLAGSVSWGIKGCNVTGNPWVYSYLPALREFVDDIIKNN